MILLATPLLDSWMTPNNELLEIFKPNAKHSVPLQTKNEGNWIYASKTSNIKY